MKELLLLLIIGISLSIDAFSVSTVIGMYNPSTKKSFITSLTVGLFHFIMPIIGLIISNILTSKTNINTNILFGTILLLLSLQMFIEYIKPTNNEITLSKKSIFLFAFGVSLDSMGVGLGLKAITDNILLSSTIFSICSFSFTFFGLTLGKYINKIFKNYSYMLGTILLFILGIYFICKCFIN